MNKNLFDGYQKLINSTANTEALTNDTLNNIAEIGIYSGYSDKVINQMSMSEHTFVYIKMALNNNIKISYDNDKIFSTIKADAEQFLLDESLFLKMRENICATNEKTLYRYQFLFTEAFPLITAEELYSISNNVKNDTKILDFISATLLTTQNISFLINFFNRKYHANSEAYEIFNFILSLENDIIADFFFSLDYENFRFRTFSKEKTQSLKLRLNKPLNLAVFENKLDFIEVTMCANEEIEASIKSEIIANPTKAQKYVAAISKVKKISNQTISIVTSLPTIYIYSDIIMKELKNQKFFEHYVISKTLANKKFIVESNEEIWSTYVDIFRSEKHQEVCEYMKKNTVFLEKFQERQEYLNMPQSTRIRLAGILQDKQCVENIFKYDTRFILNYFSQIKGFKDDIAAETFVDYVLKNDILRASQQLYDYTYKLIKKHGTKYRYTLGRKKKK